MADAVAEYGRHRKAPDEWALGRFVVPLGRWSEFGKAVSVQAPPDLPWPVSLLCTPADAGIVHGWPHGETWFVLQSIECKVDSETDLEALVPLTRQAEVFVEAARLAEFAGIAPAIARAGAFGKIRTGGVTADAFPGSRDVHGFLDTCRQHGIRFKATAGLHHAVRGEYRLTYEPSPPTGVMFGFLNIAVAAALLWFGAEEAAVIDALEEGSADAFAFSDAGITWRDHHLTPSQLDEVRSGFFAGFGSCSFREPMGEIGLDAVPRS
jgi:hypothetical protein